MNGLADHPSDALGDRGEGKSECGTSVDLREFRGDADGLSSYGDLSESERIIVARTVDGDTDFSL
jgi:hypothetical protein